MNKKENGHLVRIEDKLDDVVATSIRTETKLDEHLIQHSKRVKYALYLIGIIGTLIGIVIKWILNKFGG